MSKMCDNATANSDSSFLKRQKISITTNFNMVTCTAILLFLLATSKHIQTSGVFEMEFIKFDLLEVPPRLTHENLEPTDRINESQQHQSTHVETTSKIPLKMFICLKPAFTSQLDGPCTYGNATTTLIRETLDSSSGPVKDSKQQVTNQHQVGSLSTNLVRILFTFRWTKSFTIIITGEQMLPDAAIDEQRSSARQNHHSTSEDPNLQIDLTATGSRLVTTHPQQVVASSGTKLPTQLTFRHVLTENEVLPSLEMNPNKVWTNRSSHTLNSSLTYRFRIYCSPNYYGDGCTTFCRARDDQFGHYTCSPTGQKICNDGWYGPDCDRAKCRSGCNPLHGYCEKPDTCACFDGWTGSRCNECKTHPKCKNGYCLTKNDCLCHNGWGGQLCDQNLNYCGTHEPCKNNGSCHNTPPGGYRCTCPQGFTGINCEINLISAQLIDSLSQLKAGCTLNSCLNGGTCFGYEGGVPVEIAKSFDENQTRVDGDSPKNDEYTYRCQCAIGWTGDYCQWPDTDLISVKDIISDSESKSNDPNTLVTVTTTSISDTTDVLDPENSVHMTEDKVSPILSAFIEAPKQESVHVDMRHLISGVLIASIVGVLLAFLFLAWCCLVAIEQDRFSFIQMNIIRDSDPAVSSALRRVHNKIRDSFRLSRNRIKPETKLSIENVLRPPPTYEESSNQNGIYDKNQVEYITIDHEAGKPKDLHSKPCFKTKDNLVIGGLLHKKLHQPSASNMSVSATAEPLSSLDAQRLATITEAQLNCPRHGHLYRSNNIDVPTNCNLLDVGTSSSHLEPLKNSRFTTHLPTSSTSRGSTHHTHVAHI